MFGKPMWRKGVPLTLLALVWLPTVILRKGAELLSQAPEHVVTAYAQLALDWIQARGITAQQTAWISGALSLPLLLWFYTGLERLVVTSTMILRGYPLMPKRKIRWADLDEVIIDHLEARFEGEETARRTLTLYTRRGRFLPVRRRFRVNNRQFDGYEEVERMAVGVGVPAIADRLRRRAEESGKAARFPLRTLRERMAAGVMILLAVALATTVFYPPLWERLAATASAAPENEVPTALQSLGLKRIPNPLALPAMKPVRPVLLGIAALLLYLAARRLWYQQLAVDHENIYVMRRGRVRKTIPLDSLADIQVLGNIMRIYAYRSDTDQDPKLMWKTRRFVPNRGVFLCLIRDVYDTRRMLDLTPIVPMRSIPASEQQTP